MSEQNRNEVPTGEEQQLNGSGPQVQPILQQSDRTDGTEGQATGASISRRKLLASVGLASVAMAAGTVMSSMTPGYARDKDDDVTDSVYVNKGAAHLGKVCRHVDNVSSLSGLIGSCQGECVETTSYHPGWAGTLIGPVGGAPFVWDATRPRSQHNGGNIVSPTVPWDGTEATLAAYIAGTGETSPGATGCWVHRNYGSNTFNVLQWGAKNDATLNGANNVVLQPLFDYAEKAVGGGYGAIIKFPRGNYGIGVPLNVRDRMTLQGEGTAATILHFRTLTSGHAITLGPTGPDHPTRPPGQYVFAARLEKLAVAGGNTYKGLDRAMVYTDGAHEHSGIFECVIRDFTSFGIHYNTGNGGPALFEISDVEIYASTVLPSAGIRRGVYSSAGGALVLLRHATITGAQVTGGKLGQGVLMAKDNLVASGVHLEESAVGISLSQIAALEPRTNTLSGVTGNATVPELIEVGSTFEGSVTVMGASSTSLATTGLGVLNNRRTGEMLKDGTISLYSYTTIGGEGTAAARCRITVSGGTATVVKATGRPFTVARTSAGVITVTLAKPMPDINYVVIPTARLSMEMPAEFIPISTTVFEIRTYNTSDVLTDPGSIWFVLFS
ncbi:MAG: structural protein [Paenibacillus sp.]|nr:structural protein [Paenibacillus sp.]